MVIVAVGCCGCNGNHGGDRAALGQTAVLTAQETYESVAAEYYGAAERFLWQESQVHARGNEAMWSREAPNHPNVATGCVEDRWGRPVAGARLVVETESDGIRLGNGVTDSQGRFSVPLKTVAYRGLSLEVQARGFDRWAVSGIYGGLVNYPVRLNRVVDEGFLKRLVGQRDAAQRLRMVLELDEVSLEALFPYLGLLREDFRGLIASQRFNRPDSQLSSPASRAARTLMSWCEPEDDELIRTLGLPEDELLAPSEPFKALSGDSVDEILKKHRDESDESNAPWPSYSDVIYSKDGSRALVEASVMYAHWGYTYHLIMARKGGLWWLVGRFEHMRMHFD
jgi:hypothetical protein